MRVRVRVQGRVGYACECEADDLLCDGGSEESWVNEAAGECWMCAGQRQNHPSACVFVLVRRLWLRGKGSGFISNCS